jgi:hypothetical protein
MHVMHLVLKAGAAKPSVRPAAIMPLHTEHKAGWSNWWCGYSELFFVPKR